MQMYVHIKRLNLYLIYKCIFLNVNFILIPVGTGLKNKEDLVTHHKLAHLELTFMSFYYVVVVSIFLAGNIS